MGASVLAMEKGRTGEAYNIGTGGSTDFNTIYKIIKEEMDSPASVFRSFGTDIIYKIIKEEMDSSIEPKYEKNPFSSYQMFIQANIEKVKTELGFNPEYDIRSGVRALLCQ